MNEMNLNDETLFDRLVDGELSSEERRRLLVSLDDRPGGWRQCALAFLEAQSWRTDLGQVVKEASAAAPHPRSATGATYANRFARRRALGWLAVAAGLLLAFNLGVVWQNNSDATPGGILPDGGNSVANVTGNVGPGNSQGASPSVGKPNDALTFWVNDKSGTRQPVHVPLVDANTLDRELGVQFRSGVPDALRQHLERNGYNVHSQRRYAPLELENGRSLVVPVEDTRIVPISPVVY